MKNFKNLREDMHDRVSPYMFWKNEDPVNYSIHLSQTFGSPDELTDFRAVWYDKDGFKRIVVKDEYILHGSPAPHFDFIYCYIDLKVPHDLADALANSSESILIDFLKNEVGARCGSITANAVTLNYVLDVVAGRVRPSKNEYEKRILQMKDMFKKGETYSNDWWPDETKDADPKNPYYNKKDIENVEEAARIPRKAGQPANSKKHSDLYTDENPKGTIQGLKFTTREDATQSVRKIKNSGKKHAHKIQAAIAMEQRARVAGKNQAAAVYRSFIEQMKKKTKRMNEDKTGKPYKIGSFKPKKPDTKRIDSVRTTGAVVHGPSSSMSTPRKPVDQSKNQGIKYTPKEIEGMERGKLVKNLQKKREKEAAADREVTKQETDRLRPEVQARKAAGRKLTDPKTGMEVGKTKKDSMKGLDISKAKVIKVKPKKLPKRRLILRNNFEYDLDEASPIAKSAMRAMARISPSYKMAKKELKDKVKKDPSKAKISHAAMVAKKYSGVDARTLHDVTEQRKGLYYYINKKRKEGRPMRKKGAPGAPKPSDFDRAKTTASEEAQPTIGGVKMKKLGKGKPGGYKSLVSRHLGASAAEKIDKSDGAKLVAKGKKTGNKDLIRKGHFIKNVISKK